MSSVIHAAKALPDEAAIDDRSDSVGEGRLLDVEAERIVTGERQGSH